MGATRESAREFFLPVIQHHVYAGDTALHIAGAAFQPEIVDLLIRAGADPRARNRRGAEPLHYAADANRWSPDAQAATLRRLLEAGADPNAGDRSDVTPLHRAVRTRCAAAVEALLAGGADARRPNKTGSTPLALAVQSTGRGGSGTEQARAQQRRIVQLLLDRGAQPEALDPRGQKLLQKIFASGA